MEDREEEEMVEMQTVVGGGTPDTTPDEVVEMETVVC